MYGLMFEMIEEWAINKHGQDVWHMAKEKAECHVKDQSFLRRSYYTDEEYFDLILALSDILNVPIQIFLEAFGHFAIRHHIENGYDELLQCQGSTLRQWLSNLNAMHDHIQKTFPGKEFQAPIFWCEDCDTVKGSILLHYYSLRGVYFVPLVVGIVKEYASSYFEIDINVTQLALQDENDFTSYTTWRITAVDETQRWKLSPNGGQQQKDDLFFSPNFAKNLQQNESERCPFTGGSSKYSRTSESTKAKMMINVATPTKGCPFAHNKNDDSTTNPNKALSLATTGCPFASKNTNNAEPSSYSKKDIAIFQGLIDQTIKRNNISSANLHNTQLHNKYSATSIQDKNLAISDESVLVAGAEHNDIAPSSISKCPFTHNKSKSVTKFTEDVPVIEFHNGCLYPDATNEKEFQPTHKDGLSLSRMREVFPFHVLVDREFSILQVGKSLPSLLHRNEHDFYGKHIEKFLEISRPVLGSSWDWKALQKLADQQFFLVPATTIKTTTTSSKDRSHFSSIPSTISREGLQKKVSMIGNTIRFKASMISVSTNSIMFALSPDARNVGDLISMGLTLSDLPLASCQRDAVYLGEYITQEVDKAHKLDMLSKKLTIEKNLSNTLLYNMLPKQVADDLRSGNTIEPKFHENVTLFFSDIEGFTSICDQVDPWDVIDMLNQLYSVMDYLVGHFNLYKVETIGDAYMCCSGLPEPDEYHAENIANFAIAVTECVKQIKSPVDGSPLKLRIGIHTGSCTAGVVGTLTPHYCLFGDMVNTTARHESTGKAGKIQCSSLLYGRLHHFSMYNNNRSNIDDDDCDEMNQTSLEAPPSYYNFTSRGLVTMKGKGQQHTYWLDSATEHNGAANPQVIQQLYSEVSEMLAKKKWKMRRYFRRSGALRDETSSEAGTTDIPPISSGSSSLLDKSTTFNEENNQDYDKNLINNVNIKPPTSHRASDIHEASDNTSLLDFDDDLNDNKLDRSNIKSNVAITSDMNYMEEVDKFREIQEEQDREVSFTEELSHKESDRWNNICWSSNVDLTMDDLTTRVHDLLFFRWKQCQIHSDDYYSSSVADKKENLVKCQLLHYVNRMRNLYNCTNGDNVLINKFGHVCHVVLSADYLWEEVVTIVTTSSNKDHSKTTYTSNDPWNHFIILFAALTYDINNVIDVHTDHRMALNILEDDFPELYDELVYACPTFLLLVRKAIVAAMSFEYFDSMKEMERRQGLSEKFEKVMSNSFVFNRDFRERTTVMLETVLSMASVAHYAQDYDSSFLHWNRDILLRKQLSGGNPKKITSFKDNWYIQNKIIFKSIVLPLVHRIERVIPQSSCRLREGVERNMALWEEEGEEWSNSQVNIATPKSHETSETRDTDQINVTDDDSTVSLPALDSSSTNVDSSDYSLTSRIVHDVDRLAKCRKLYEKKMDVTCKTLVAVATKEDGAEALKKHNSLHRLHRFLRQQDWYKLHSEEGWSSDEEEEVREEEEDDKKETEKILFDDESLPLVYRQNLLHKANDEQLYPMLEATHYYIREGLGFYNTP